MSLDGVPDLQRGRAVDAPSVRRARKSHHLTSSSTRRGQSAFCAL